MEEQRRLDEQLGGLKRRMSELRHKKGGVDSELAGMREFERELASSSKTNVG